jgi:hypothetical protein
LPCFAASFKTAGSGFPLAVSDAGQQLVIAPNASLLCPVAEVYEALFESCFAALELTGASWLANQPITRRSNSSGSAPAAPQ